MKRKLCFIIPAVVVVLAVAIFGVIAMKGYIFNDSSSFDVVSESTLREVLEVSKLSTAEYTYNSVAEIHDKEKKVIKCYVKYDGTVTAGIDFNKIKIDITNDSDISKITLILPAVEIHDVMVNSGTMKYIFTEDKYDTAELPQEAYIECLEDLDAKVKSENDLLVMAKENAIRTVEGLVSPWVKQLDREYEIVVK